MNRMMNRYIRCKIRHHCSSLTSSIRLLSYNKSTTNDESNGRLRVLLKKFLLHVHPDFFHAHKQEQLCNENNIKTLLALDVFNNDNGGSVPFRNDQATMNTRTLIFYIKSSATEDKPRRIKISIHRVEESIREVLETLGVDGLPPRPDAQSSSSYVSSNPIEVSAFLDTLIDRKELMIWRQQRMVNFLKMNDTLKEVLGVENIDLRLSWSAQNNSYLMASLLRLIESERTSMCLPWTGLSLVFTADDCTSHPIDAIEAEIKINPTHVPAQWVSILTSVDNDIIKKAADFKSEMMMMKESAELLATDQLRQTMLEVLNNSKQASDSAINNDELRMILEGLRVTIKRGNTIDNKWFTHFLKSLLQVKRRNPLDDLTISGDADSIDESNNSKETSLMVNPVHKFWLQQLPLNIELVVEHGHGTKLLRTGQLRVDARVSESSFFALIRDQGLASISLIAAEKARDTIINEMKEEIKLTIGVQSIEAGIGISSPTMENCLVRLTDYINKSNNGGKLRSLAGFSVKIGKYIGFTDDGCCIIPENWDLQ